MPDKVKRVLLTLVEIILCLVIAWWLLCAWGNFDHANRLREYEPWLVSETEPDAMGAMTTLEEEQFKWRFAGGLSILFVLPPLGAEIALHRHRRERGT